MSELAKKNAVVPITQNPAEILLATALVSKLQERDRSREESKLYEPFSFMPCGDN